MTSSILSQDPGIREKLTDYDIRVMCGSLYQELLRINDPHEFATAFVNWRESAPPNIRVDMWSAYNAFDYWRAYGSLDKLPYERFGDE